MFRSRTLSVLLLAVFLFMGQAALIPGDVDAAIQVPFYVWAAGYYVYTQTPNIIRGAQAVGAGIGIGVAANYIYNSLTDDDSSSSSSSSSSGSSSTHYGEGYGECGTCNSYYSGSHYCWSRD